MAGGVVSSKKLAVAERRNLAVELRKSGMSFRDISSAIQNEMIVRMAPEIVEKMDADKRPFSDIVQAVRDYLLVSGRKIPTYTHTTARRDVNAIMDQINAETTDEALRLRSMMDLQLDTMMTAHWDSASAGDIDSGNMVLRIMAMRIKLFALDKIDELPVEISQQNLFVNPLDGLSEKALGDVARNLALQMGGNENDSGLYQFIEQLGEATSVPFG